MLQKVFCCFFPFGCCTSSIQLIYHSKMKSREMADGWTDVTFATEEVRGPGLIRRSLELQISLYLLTHDTTLPLKQGNLALSSEISSFTTLENRKRKKRQREGLGKHKLLCFHNTAVINECGIRVVQLRGGTAAENRTLASCCWERER